MAVLFFVFCLIVHNSALQFSYSRLLKSPAHLQQFMAIRIEQPARASVQKPRLPVEGFSMALAVREKKQATDKALVDKKTFTSNDVEFFAITISRYGRFYSLLKRRQHESY